MIGRTKEDISITKLCSNLPRELGTYLRYVKALKFNDTPDYNYLRNTFRSCLISRRLPEDDVFDWMVLYSQGASPRSPESGHQSENLVEKTSIAKPPQITLASPTKTYYTGNLNRGISRSAGIIESSAGVVCSPIVSDSMLESEIEEDPSSNKVG